jgi:hypothetical protein
MKERNGRLGWLLLALASVCSAQETIADESGDNLTALGTLALLPSSLTGNWLIYPSAAYVEGDVSGANVDGYMFIVYGSRTIGDSGAYIWVWPEYLDLSGAGVDTDSLTLTGQYAKPLNEDRSM